MELNAEINKVFGQEMAKLFAAQIDEEQMKKEALNAWHQLREEKWNYGTYGSEFKSFVACALKDEMQKEIEAITNSEQFKTECRELAKQMVEEIREQTYIKVVNEVSDRLAACSVGWNGLGLKSMIEQTIMEMMQR